LGLQAKTVPCASVAMVALGANLVVASLADWVQVR
jgi:hypothetical protein